MDALLEEIRTRLRQLLDGLARGDDAPPGQRLRLEGLQEAAVLVGAATPLQLDAELERVYREVFGRELTRDFGADWREFYPFPQVPAVGRRAPVHPSTAD